MIYDLSNPFHKERATTKFGDYLANGKVIELAIKKKKRSVEQNAYLHVLITLVAIFMGYTIEEAKVHLKRKCHFMIYEKEGEKFLRQTSKMNSQELTEFIEWLRTYSAKELGLYLATPEEYLQNQFEINNEINLNKEFL